ncbi:MAG: ZIP family metal transporter [Gammaproteobacteria bacterium]|nr:MAG: ZIP family metal transporter [Gammaproteobacteria bacterium]
MDTLFYWIVGFTLLGTVLSAAAAGVILLFPEAVRTRMVTPLISFATGALLGAAFLGLLPHALEHPAIEGAHGIAMTVLVGLLVFFLLEKMVIWRHCHSDQCEAHAPDMEDVHNRVAGKLILVGDGFHNFVDGVLIAAAFMTDIHLGVVTSMAVIAHEIPQEVGDFAILLQSGYQRARAFFFNIASGLTGVVGGVVSYFFLAEMQQVVPYVLAFAASSFIYIAVADLIPGLHKKVEMAATALQVILIISGVVVIYLVHSTLH